MGLIAPTERTEGNFRLYDASTVERIKYIQLLKSQHLTLDEIRQRLDLFNTHVKELDPAVLLDKIQKVSEQLTQVEMEIQKLTPSLANMKVNESKMMTRELATQLLSITQAILLLLPQ